MKREAKGSSKGGQFAPDTSGKTPPPTDPLPTDGREVLNPETGEGYGPLWNAFLKEVPPEDEPTVQVFDPDVSPEPKPFLFDNMWADPDDDAVKVREALENMVARDKIPANAPDDCGISTDGRVFVEWSRQGEGLWGEYDPDDPEDTELLRYDAYVRLDYDMSELIEAAYSYEGWGIFVMHSSSFCTNVPVGTSKEDLIRIATYMANELSFCVDYGWKKRAEEMSWANTEWANR